MPYPGLLHPEPLPLRQALLTGASTGDTQTQFWLSLCGVSGSWCTQGLFEPSKCLWWEWGLILNAILPLIPSCGATAPFSWSWCTQGFVCVFQESISSVLCKFWQLYDGVNGDLLQEGLFHTQICCTQRPCPMAVDC